jgi:hypothetical protein
MGQSYRIRTELGTNKTINVQLDQDFEFLEILSLKIQQSDIYSRSCADYGVIVGRVTANNGFGLPNARVSVFIPIDSVDESNPIISSIYPYKSPTDKNEDGYRYNLLPYEKSYSKHAATGTLPSRIDALTGLTAVEIYDKYYRFTTKTNESGDYMIMGAPLGNQTIFMDVDLSDIGEFSLTPQDLIRMGLATPAQVAGNKFRTSTDLNSLPQIVSLSRSIEVSPLWGDPNICQIAISRTDFDLRDDSNINIEPTSVFMGSIYSSSEQMRVRNNCKPKDNLGDLCGLVTGPGQILAIRQTVNQDSEGNPVLEQYQLEQAGNIIDGDGTWITEMPMNLDYLVTNEFGETILSNDPAFGIPTKGKYRFKVKWQQPNDIALPTRRAYHLVPNVKEYGWVSSDVDPTYYDSSSANYRKQSSSYYFGLAWSGYTDGFVGSEKKDRLNEIINAEDTFYELKFNKVYTVSSLIDEYKKGTRGKFIGIKEIDNNSCVSTINKFPVNDGFKSFDLLFFIVSLLLQIFQFIGIGLIIAVHLLATLWTLTVGLICLICRVKIPVINVRPFGFICNVLSGLFGFNVCNNKRFQIRLPMITYPDCEACECDPTTLISQPIDATTNGVLSYLSSPGSYYENLSQYLLDNAVTLNKSEEDIPIETTMYSEVLSGNDSQLKNTGIYKVPKSNAYTIPTIGHARWARSTDLPIGERINVFNSRFSYFYGDNRIKATFSSNYNNSSTNYHFDNTITVLSNLVYTAGDLLTSVSPISSTDTNFLYTAQTNNGVVRGITGTSQTSAFSLTVNYASPNAGSELVNVSQIYNLPTGTTINRQEFPMDREYFQVVTAITMSEAIKIWNLSLSSQNTYRFPNILTAETSVTTYIPTDYLNGYKKDSDVPYRAIDLFSNIGEQYILILQRGVDPYSPKYINQYNLGVIFGSTIDDPKFIITANTRTNIPIQVSTSSSSIGAFNVQTDMFYQSKFFTAGNQFSAFTSSTVGYYGALDNTNYSQIAPTYLTTETIYGTIGVRSQKNGMLTGIGGGLQSSKYMNTPPLFQDLSGGAVMRFDPNVVGDKYSAWQYSYIPRIFYDKFNQTPMTFTSSNKGLNVMRTDRLPSSDQLDGGSWSSNPALLQQNNNFTFYVVPDVGIEPSATGFRTGAQQANPDIEGLPNSIKVGETFSCTGMTQFKCYQGWANTFGVNEGCAKNDAIQNGCYVFVKEPFIDLINGKDFTNFEEWASRYRFTYGLCRGVLSQTFTNNWINGSLFAFPIQVNTKYNKKNQAYSTLCADTTYYDKKTQNFYYRSSPYNDSRNEFIGFQTKNVGSINNVNLLFPTTMVNLGMKDYFYSEITFDPSTKSYLIPNLPTTSYSDTSDLVNFFAITRMTNSNFVGELTGLGSGSINSLFKREDFRVDGDFAQLASINSEIGNVDFSPEFYESAQGPPMTILGTYNNPVMAVWFSSTTQDLQTKDYLTPGVIDFRGVDNVGFYPYPYGIKSQVVPFYRWKLATQNIIFGDQKNTWGTSYSVNPRLSDIVQNTPYQSLDRSRSDTPYFWSSTSGVNNLNARGYIFNMDANGNYISTGGLRKSFIVGAPFQFYFGINKGKSALDKFKTKYSVDE